MSDTSTIEPIRRRSRRTNHKSDEKQTPRPSGNAAASKKAKLEALLARARGATLSQLKEELGWQPHTVRAAISGLRKAGHTIELEEMKGRKTYRLSV
jgi:predicted ArsR family transcriptional regulator